MTFSIIIPTYNRKEQLIECLNSIKEIDYPRELFEVIVVDDGGVIYLDNIVHQCKEYINITLIKEANCGPAKARNTGVFAASGKYVVFLDDDCIVPPSWLKLIDAHYKKYPNSVLGGRTVNVHTNNVYSTASQTIVDFVYNYNIKHNNKALFFASNNLSVPISACYAIGCFNASFNIASEDREICRRLLAHGYTLMYVPEVIVYHGHFLTFRSFIYQHYNYGRGVYKYHNDLFNRVNLLVSVKQKGFYFYLMSYSFKLFPVKKAVIVSILTMVAQLASLGGFFYEVKKEIWKALWHM
ncbi:MAG: glycosyltransferase family 2 protein [Candidatus Magnetoovum sp. WYHC-5]|nr:glycosyltransferase family 2 protein [Candidatus Magnetoovum sp. WYHC-5]